MRSRGKLTELIASQPTNDDRSLRQMMAGVTQRYFTSIRDLRMWASFLAFAFMNLTLKKQKDL